jgi:hypothetical protein
MTVQEDTGSWITPPGMVCNPLTSCSRGNVIHELRKTFVVQHNMQENFVKDENASVFDIQGGS